MFDFYLVVHHPTDRSIVYHLRTVQSISIETWLSTGGAPGAVMFSPYSLRENFTKKKHPFLRHTQG